ncbi:ABC transporter substrate-binding protein [Actinoplanes sp. TBRC 11911]|uniref:ABC transporter substrate-binding protein n=1 Tax=Actinoplanes sp. TBRC 11911 TaxID=2729386 RepID=UPI00145EDD01|nr:ABC transporter substrate-binding protein [Actinoplanes sp. TBRC 11911]NMO52866.1 ABC transporter substrate-binding protein [Actinoplanes sp. TBRC 11911]
MASPRVTVAAGVVVALGVTAGACQDDTKRGETPSGFNAALTTVVNPSAARGGTLNLWSAQDADSWDPARGYLSLVWNMNRLYTRKLVDYAGPAGPDGGKLVPDLAAAEPRISADKRTYTFTLRDGLKWDDGSPITTRDIKYGIERSWATKVITGGPYYLPHILDNGQHYPGPYEDRDPARLGLRSVRTPDDKTITFSLAAPDPDFLYLLAMPAAGPVPRARDTGARYGARPASSGPYMFDDIRPGRSARLVRNPRWDPATDPIRKALPDAVDFTVTTNQDDLDRRLLAGTVDLDIGGLGVQAAARSRVLADPRLMSHADAVAGGYLWFAALVPAVAPFGDIACRRAVMYAADLASIQAARGGPFAGTIATSMLPSGTPVPEPDYDPYQHKQGKPRIDLALRELRSCGKPNGFGTTIAVLTDAGAVRVAEALQAALKKVNINAKIDRYALAEDSSQGGSPNMVREKGYGIIISSFAPDYPTGGGLLEPLANGDAIQQNGNTNRAEINDPSINELFDAAATASDPASLYRRINHKVMEGAYYLPFTLDVALTYRNPRLTNVHVQAGAIDIQALGVHK